MSKIKPGNTAPSGGEYHVIGPRGGDTGNTVHVHPGKPMPPTPKPNETFKK